MIDNKNNLPELPKGWVWTRLGDVGEYINGKAFKPTDWENEGRPIIRIQNLTGSTKTLNRYSKPIEEKFIIRDGELLISWSATLGAFIYHGEEAVLNQHIFKVVPFINKLFLFYLTSFSISQLMQKIHGSGMQHITKGKFDSHIIPLPPLIEQHRIVSKVEELFTKLDAGVEALKKIKTQLKRYRQSVLKSAMEGKLTEEWRETHKHELEHASVLLERIKEERKKKSGEKYKKLPPVDAENLPELPEGWCWTRLEGISEINPKFNGETILGGIDVTFLPMKCVEELTGHIDLTFTKKLSEVKKGYTPFINGDLLFAKITPCMENGKVAIAHSLKNGIGFGSTEFHVIRLSEALPRKFFFFFLIREELRGAAQRKMTGSAGQLRVPVNYMHQIPIPLPPLIEQHKIVEEIEKRFTVADEVEKTVEQSFKQSERLRQSILKKAFEGKLVPQDPTDEPASVLLDKIKKEKEKLESDKKAKRKGRRVKKKKIP
ncbi:MAG: restriction endonuclease subunit S [Thermoplasmatales archaeon]|nr:restriction endonuclease subunit S [Thermoplasmatales archaeon]